VKNLVCIKIVCLVWFAASPAYAQTLSSFTVDGEVLKPLTLTRDNLVGMFKQDEIRTTDKDGKEHVFKGVKLISILDSAGVTLGGQLRGQNLAKYVLIKAVDGYQVVFSIAEIDEGYSAQTILLAYDIDDAPLPKGEGPFRMIVPGDKRHARWIREITTIKVIIAKQ